MKRAQQEDLYLLFRSDLAEQKQACDPAAVTCPKAACFVITGIPGDEPATDVLPATPTPQPLHPSPRLSQPVPTIYTQAAQISGQRCKARRPRR